MKINILRKLGKNLRKYRDQTPLSQEKLAEIVGVHPTYIGKIETGKSSPSIKLLFAISRALNVKLSNVFDFD